MCKECIIFLCTSDKDIYKKGNYSLIFVMKIDTKTKKKVT